METDPWWELEVDAVVDAVAPLVYATARAFAAWVWVSWMSRYRETCTSVCALRWVLVSFLGTSTQVLDGLFTVGTWRVILFMARILATKSWLGVLFVTDVWLRGLMLAKISAVNTCLAAVSLFRLVGSVGLTVLTSDVLVAVLFLQAAAISIWVLATYDPGLEGTEQQQQVRYNCKISSGATCPAS